MSARAPLERLAPAKINLGLAVGPLRDDGRHEVATIMQRLDLADTITLAPAARLAVAGFEGDTLVRRALEAVAEAAGVQPAWRAEIRKRVPVAAGLGGGSSDAAAALLLGNELLERPLPHEALAAFARRLGSDVPFFLEPGPKLASGDGSTLSPLELPQDYSVVLLLPAGARKPSTSSVYARFRGAEGFAERSGRLREIAAAGARAELAALPRNDLARSPHAEAMRSRGAFRADVSGAGPVVYGLFAERRRGRGGRRGDERPRHDLARRPGVVACVVNGRARERARQSERLEACAVPARAPVSADALDRRDRGPARGLPRAWTGDRLAHVRARDHRGRVLDDGRPQVPLRHRAQRQLDLCGLPGARGAHPDRARHPEMGCLRCSRVDRGRRARDPSSPSAAAHLGRSPFQRGDAPILGAQWGVAKR